MLKRIYFSLFLLLLLQGLFAQAPANYTNEQWPIEKRTNDLLQRLTLLEKINLLLYNSPGVARLDIPAYNWWNEALHGVARAGRATVFPQAIGLAASFDDELIKRVATVISDEARAKYNAAIQQNNRSQYLGLSFWSPNINIFRDPRWGRGHETYGEDPYLTGRIGTAYVKGMQGDDPNYFKTVACAKHFAVHSGPEPNRHQFNAVISNADLRNTYLPAFQTLVTKANVGGIMCAYNRVDSIPCCGNHILLQDILRKEWGFKGYVVSDCWALDDIFRYHRYLKTPEEAAAIAIKNGVNVECGNTYQTLQTALDKKLISATDIDNALRNNLQVLFKLGWFNQFGKGRYDQIAPGNIDLPAHRALAKEIAIKSMVLLSNKNNTLPLSPNLKNILITGPNADATDVLLANYNGSSDNLVTIQEGITHAVSPSTVIIYNKGCELTDTSKRQIHWMINQADAVIAVLGLSPLLEGENGDANLSEAGGDKKDIHFPLAQLNYLKALRTSTKKPIIVVLMTGSAIELKEVEGLADAILLAWYPGEEGGNAVADILFGKANPAGRLPISFYTADEKLPAFDNYAMQGRTYRYAQDNISYPFGFGLSYTKFEYSQMAIVKKNNTYQVSCNIRNTGQRDGEELLQLYIRHEQAGMGEPIRQLKNFKRIMLRKGEQKKLVLRIEKEDFQYWDEQRDGWLIYPGKYTIELGASSADIKLSTTMDLK